MPVTSPCRIAGLALAGALVAIASTAAAQVPEPFPTYRRGDGYTYRKDTTSKRPLKGHEGFYGIGPNLRYCSYIRTPNRECGPKGCRVTSWTTQQYCH